MTRHLRKMKAARQVEAVELMIVQQFDRVINTTSMEEALEQQGHVEETVLAEFNDPAAPEGADG